MVLRRPSRETSALVWVIDMRARRAPSARDSCTKPTTTFTTTTPAMTAESMYSPIARVMTTAASRT